MPGRGIGATCTHNATHNPVPPTSAQLALSKGDYGKAIKMCVVFYVAAPPVDLPGPWCRIFPLKPSCRCVRVPPRRFDKSISLYPVPGVPEMKARAVREMAGAASKAREKANSGATSTPASPRQTTSGDGRPYTPEQTAIVKKILQVAKKGHYEVLGLGRDASVSRRRQCSGGGCRAHTFAHPSPLLLLLTAPPCAPTTTTGGRDQKILPQAGAEITSGQEQRAGGRQCF